MTKPFPNPSLRLVGQTPNDVPDPGEGPKAPLRRWSDLVAAGAPESELARLAFDHFHEMVFATASRIMGTLNKAASEAMLASGVHAATDITGFGFLGHSASVARQSKVTFEFEAKALPLFPGALELVAKGVMSGGSARTREFLGEEVAFGPGPGAGDSPDSPALIAPRSGDRPELPARVTGADCPRPAKRGEGQGEGPRARRLLLRFELVDTRLEGADARFERPVAIGDRLRVPDDETVLLCQVQNCRLDQRRPPVRIRS